MTLSPGPDAATRRCISRGECQLLKKEGRSKRIHKKKKRTPLKNGVTEKVLKNDGAVQVTESR